MRVLGIESSCDETGVALYDSDAGLIAQQLYSQVELHADYGGVVPELASRDHIRKTLPLVRQTLDDAGLGGQDVDGVAYTAGPGLIGALLVGAAIGRSLAYAWGVPAIGVHHMEGHLLAPMLERDAPAFPLVALLVSGGHTQLVRVDGIGHYQLLGESLDDAAGEAFDKTAKLLGLPYPGGPALARLAEQGDSAAFSFTRPMINRPGLDFSFSGLKTQVLNTVTAASERGLSDQSRADIAASFQRAVIDTLAIKCRRALDQTGLGRLLIAGGDSANVSLREALEDMVRQRGATVHYARPEFCTDNGAMIAYAGCQRLLAGQADDLSIQARARWALDSLPTLGQAPGSCRLT